MVPLSYAEKTQGKAIVDILTYRVAKGGASLLLMGIIAVSLGGWVAWLCLTLVVGWLAVTSGIVKRYGTLTDGAGQPDEQAPEIQSKNGES